MRPRTASTSCEAVRRSLHHVFFCSSRRNAVHQRSVALNSTCTQKHGARASMRRTTPAWRRRRRRAAPRRTSKVARGATEEGASGARWVARWSGVSHRPLCLGTHNPAHRLCVVSTARQALHSPRHPFPGGGRKGTQAHESSTVAAVAPGPRPTVAAAGVSRGQAASPRRPSHNAAGGPTAQA